MVLAALLGAVLLFLAVLVALRLMRALLRAALVLFVFVLLGGLLVRYGGDLKEAVLSASGPPPATSL